MNFKDTTKWYVRWFFWSADIWLTFREREYAMMELRERGTNLCFFIRTMFVSAPLVILLHIFVYGTAVVAVTYWPVKVFGAVGYLSTLLVGGSIALTIFLRNKSRESKRKLEETRQRVMAQYTEAMVAEYVALPASPTFRSVAWEWILAQKKKVCPLITFTRQEAQQ
jgi:hypothetical protein